MIFDYESECSTDQHRAWLSIFRLYESRSPSPKMTLLYLSEAMVRNISKEHFVATSVLMAFEDGSVSFCIPEGATLADISENLDKVGKWHTGKLVSIDVRFKTPGESGFGCGPDHPLISSSVSQLAGTTDHLTARFDHSAWLHRLFDGVLRG
jgi:hypothetical protein